MRTFNGRPRVDPVKEVFSLPLGKLACVWSVRRHMTIPSRSELPQALSVHVSWQHAHHGALGVEQAYPPFSVGEFVEPLPVPSPSCSPGSSSGAP